MKRSASAILFFVLADGRRRLPSARARNQTARMAERDRPPGRAVAEGSRRPAAPGLRPDTDGRSSGQRAAGGGVPEVVSRLRRDPVRVDLPREGPLQPLRADQGTRPESRGPPAEPHRRRAGEGVRLEASAVCGRDLPELSLRTRGLRHEVDRHCGAPRVRRSRPFGDHARARRRLPRRMRRGDGLERRVGVAVRAPPRCSCRGRLRAERRRLHGDGGRNAALLGDRERSERHGLRGPVVRRQGGRDLPGEIPFARHVRSSGADGGPLSPGARRIPSPFYANAFLHPELLRRPEVQKFIPYASLSLVTGGVLSTLPYPASNLPGIASPHRWDVSIIISTPVGVDPRPSFEATLSAVLRPGVDVVVQECEPPSRVSPFPSADTEAVSRVLEAAVPGVPVDSGDQFVRGLDVVDISQARNSRLWIHSVPDGPDRRRAPPRHR